MSLPDIRNFSYEELLAYMKSIGESAFRAGQIFEWIYQKQVKHFSQMTNLSSHLQKRLQSDFVFFEPKVGEKQISSDGTTKILFDLNDNEKIETVLIPVKSRTTVCISTQAGCKFGCKFCASGIGGWKRNLSVAEIMNQVLYVKEEAQKHDNPLSHIVFMGVGEPLDNFSNLMKAIRIINHKKGINIGARRITVSTCGVIPNILQLGREGLQIELAISLHGYDNESRDVLMPVNKKYPFDDLIQACKDYQRNYRRQITFEYILIKGVTCSEKAIKALKKAFKGLICKMNLIPYNPVLEFNHKTPSRQDMFKFRDQLKSFGIHATIRSPRGQDIAAACGQLRIKKK